MQESDGQSCWTAHEAATGKQGGNRPVTEGSGRECQLSAGNEPLPLIILTSHSGTYSAGGLIHAQDEVFHDLEAIAGDD